MKTPARLLLVLLVLASLPVACGAPGPVSQAQPPMLLVLAPVNGQQVPQGQPLIVQSTATDGQGVARVELWVDGALVHVASNPAPAANIPFSVQQTWLPTIPGSHSISVVAYNVAGVASSPVLVNITTVAAGNIPLPTTPPSPVPPPLPVASETPGLPGPSPTATWTPIVVGPGLSPPPAWPTDTQPAPTATNTSRPPSAGGGGGTRPSSPGPITDLEQFGTWKRGDQPNGTFVQSAEQVHSGSYAGKLTYNFPSGGNDFVVFLQTYKLGGRPNQISAWVYGDGRKHYLNVWVRDAAGETWQFPLGQVKHTGWQQMVAWLDPAAPWPAGHIDGPSNGALDYPIDFRGLVLDDIPDSFSGSGVIYVDDLRCAEAARPAPTATATATRKPSPQPPAGTPYVHFWADTYSLHPGECTRLRWDVENVREVYLDGEGVTGHGKKKVCPTVTTVYQLKVVYLDGTAHWHSVTITVTAP